MTILGINGGVNAGLQDVSAVLLIDGKVIAAIEEERLNRIKHSPGQLPELSVKAVLKRAGISFHEVDYVVSHGATWGNEHVEVIKRYFKYNFGHCPKIKRVHHHTAHAASTFFASGFDKAMIITADNSGDGISTQLALGDENGIEVVERFSRPNSLGIFYSMMAQFCGFAHEREEYKFMGLSSYGDKTKYDFDWLLSFGEGSYQLNPDYLTNIKPGAPSPTRQQMLFNKKLISKLGAKRLPEEPLTEFYKDVAASAQGHLENVLIDMVMHFQRQTGIRKLCLAGGVALNCVANQKLMNLDCIDDLYIQPAASDAGVSLGAAYLIAAELGDKPQPMASAYLGEEFSNNQIEDVLKVSNINYTKAGNPAAYAANKVAENKIVGWFQGRAEYGPRALGNRSILANPMTKEMKNIINDKIKFRESFRPFCPTVIEEDLPIFFDGKSKTSPYMTVTYNVKESASELIPSVTHRDNTARIQTVNEKQNPLFYAYLKELKELIGVGVTLNTSFNLRGEPIVDCPRDALASFYSSGMDCLVMGNYVIEK